MSHEITSTDRVLVHGNGTTWHGIHDNADGTELEAFLRAAGLDFMVNRCPVTYTDSMGQTHTMPDRDVLYTSDTGEPLNVVSTRYKLQGHQPRDILQNMMDICRHHGIRLETAGTLKGRRIFWALASTGDALNLKGDITKSYIFLSSGVDGQNATHCSETSWRIVCNNTLQAAIGGAGGYRQRHSGVVDWDDAKRSVGVLLEDHAVTWGNFADRMRKLADCPVDTVAAQRLFAQILNDGSKVVDPIPMAGAVAADAGDTFSALLGRPRAPIAYQPVTIKDESQAFSRLMESYHTAPGQDTDAARGTCYGALQAVTHFVDHTRRSRSEDHRQTSAWLGAGSKLKQRAVEVIEQYADNKLGITA